MTPDRAVVRRAMADAADFPVPPKRRAPALRTCLTCGLPRPEGEIAHTGECYDCRAKDRERRRQAHIARLLGTTPEVL